MNILERTFGLEIEFANVEKKKYHYRAVTNGLTMRSFVIQMDQKEHSLPSTEVK